MKARTTPAVKIDTPPPWNCGPGLMPGRPPSGVVSSQGTSLSWMNGTITKMPTMPKMMLGMAASISKAVPTTRATAGWTSSTSSSAMTSASGTAIEMLAAIPSIIFGMVGIFVIVPFIQDKLVPWLLTTPLGGLPGIKPGPQFQGGGVSIFTAGVVLAFMVLPYITAVSRDVLKMVPQVTKEAGYGMGSTTWEVMHKISLRYANSGIVGAVFIGLGRALGETMAVAFLIGSLYTD